MSGTGDTKTQNMKIAGCNDFWFKNMAVLEKSILDFFSNETNFSALKAIISNKHTQPRLIDYYVTQFSKNTPEFFLDYGNINDVYNSYKLQLKGYHKRHFNLFDKKNICTIKCGSHFLLLPLAKVNVYRWLISHKITDILEEKHALIQKNYYDFRKMTIDRSRKRGKMTIFTQIPTLILGLNKLKKSIQK